MNWSNEVFYDNQLTANETVKDITLHDICPNLKHNHVLNSPIFMINMDGEKERTREKLEDYSFTNKDEAQVVSDYVLRLIVDLGLDAKQIAVIAPYYAQIEELRRSIRFPVDVNTVDAFQGHEREVVIFCLVRDNNEGMESCD
uniref:DNA replication ATP-dependent helicase/nuclease n=1 Tax=Caenorhabditis japonica TaxID=281687 RepID=A0A8R1HZY3_CAEJA